MEVFAAMVETMDRGIGRLVNALKEAGQYENTLICCLQDNGGCAEAMGRGPKGQPRAVTATLPPLSKDYLQPDMIPKQTRDGFPMRQGKGVMAGAGDTFIGYGEAWAAVSNTTFRKYKHWVHEGGISTPLIAHWPAGMKARSGGDAATHRMVEEPCHLIDLMATAVDVAGATYPKEFNGQPIKPMEGKSLKPLLVSPASHFSDSESPRALFWEHEGNRAVRTGDWKIVADFNKPWELYNIAQDRSEQHDLSAEQPERVKAMAAMYEAYAQRANVEPWEKVMPKPQAKNGKQAK
jgi:arylsulfatase